MFSWQTQPLTWMHFLGMLIGAVIVLFLVLFIVMYTIYFERKVIGWMQNRIGPNRVGPFGLLQSAADVFKLLLKEDIIPANADRPMFLIAPIIAFVPSFMVLAVIPYTATHIFTAGLNVGVLYYIALSSISIVGIVLGGWASNNKYSLVGGLRSAAQMISYEIPLGLSILGVIMLAGSLNLNTIVTHQATDRFGWYIIPQIIGFVVFVIAAIAELNRTPFDLPEAESELVAGYFTEYTGFRFAFYMLAEYVYVFAISALGTTLFLGGWEGPFLPSWLWFAIKTSAFIFFLFWVRATMPRIRIDQLMGFAWKVLIPVALFNILLTGALSLIL
ncbi:NADH-quinone oxidoreductase subunit NuoH [Sulfoacidibacillus thermotolerans]|uniref:NADH-quinone oxidoreductase subunit H n=1 Tax=Sulfoacidibacillus thermotolerans TaxID=1765684 RepID=A0A2U3D9P1_SULT2|nr:NADH-quinone oxidoreductase subunit NuoH [Sulfoacidibacillus thermotolerans]PWI57985.1 NADH-quinone oxidoreductase subunit H [Sulfoacidibacillus thermotolerans]